jgi:CspA family cold shock protein
MTVGTVTSYDRRKGYGFISPADGSRRVFLHVSALERAGLVTLAGGQRVNYELVHERGRESVANLSVIK